MAHFELERPEGAAVRLWYSREGRPPVLLAPRKAFRDRFGETYDFGKGADGCRLAAAVLLHAVGLTTWAALYLAPMFAKQHLRTCQADVCLMSEDGVRHCAYGLVQKHRLGLGAIYAREGRNGRS